MCSSCSSSVSYEDCQKKLTVVNCTDPSEVCYQADTKYKKEDGVTIIIKKGCLKKDFCNAYSKGDIEECKKKEAQGYSVDCKAKCCSDGNKCNEGNLLTPPVNPDLPLKCSSCSSSVSYDDCQKKLTVVNCTDPNEVCYQADTKYKKGDEVTIIIEKGCLKKDFCNAYSKGDIGECKTKEAQDYSVDCKAKCCSDGNKCNEGNLLPNQGSAFVISVMVLLLSVLLTLGSVN